MRLLLIPWLLYLLAFLLGSLTAWLLAKILVKHDSDDAAFSDLPTAQFKGAKKK